MVDGGAVFRDWEQRKAVKDIRSMPQVAADEPGLSDPLTDGPRRATTTACSSGRANGCTKEPREGFADTPSRPSRSMAQTISEPPSSLSASCRPRMPTSRTFDAGPRLVGWAGYRDFRKVPRAL